MIPMLKHTSKKSGVQIVTDFGELADAIQLKATSVLETDVQPRLVDEWNRQAVKAKGKTKKRTDGLGTPKNIRRDVVTNWDSDSLVFGGNKEEMYKIIRRGGYSSPIIDGEHVFSLLVVDEITEPRESVFGPFAKNIYSEDPTLFSHWVNDKKKNWMDLKAYFQLGCPSKASRKRPKRTPRPYVDKTFARISTSNAIVSAVRRGLSK